MDKTNLDATTALRELMRGRMVFDKYGEYWYVKNHRLHAMDGGSCGREEPLEYFLSVAPFKSREPED